VIREEVLEVRIFPSGMAKRNIKGKEMKTGAPPDGLLPGVLDGERGENGKATIKSEKEKRTDYWVFRRKGLISHRVREKGAQESMMETRREWCK